MMNNLRKEIPKIHPEKSDFDNYEPQEHPLEEDASAYMSRVLRNAKFKMKEEDNENSKDE